MPCLPKRQSAFKLSICIGTFNRAAFIGATLDSIIGQVTDDCEIVISDNASTDNTEQVVSEYARRFDRLRYFRQDTNKGMDQNYDRVIELAQGEYCWLFSDDDLMKPNAVSRVLAALHRDLSLIVVNVDVMNFEMTKILQPSSIDFESDRTYGPEEMDRLFVEMNRALMYIGNFIVRRSIWLSRERQKYYGSLFIFVGTMLQAKLPGQTLVIAEPLVSYRMGNEHTYSKNRAEILFFNWPTVVASLALSESVRKEVASAEPWRHVQRLLLLRALGLYSLTEYQRWIRPQVPLMRQRSIPMLIAVLPAVLINTLLVLYHSARGDRERWVEPMRRSRFHLSNWRPFNRGVPST